MGENEAIKFVVHDNEYPEDGYVGPYDTEQEAVDDALVAYEGDRESFTVTALRGRYVWEPSK